MRVLSLLLIGGLVLFASAPAWATPTTIPFNQAYNGPVIWHISNWDAGTVYTGFLTNGDPVQTGVAYSPGQLQSLAAPGPAGVGNGWGIFKLDQVEEATLLPDGQMTGNGTTLYNQGDQGVEVVGVFWGRQDDKIVFQLDPVTGALTQQIYSDPMGYTGEQMKLYVEPTADLGINWDTGMGGTGASLTAGIYPGIGTDALGNLLPGAALDLTGYMQPGFEGARQ